MLFVNNVLDVWKCLHIHHVHEVDMLEVVDIEIHLILGKNNLRPVMSMVAPNVVTNDNALGGVVPILSKLAMAFAINSVSSKPYMAVHGTCRKP